MQRKSQGGGEIAEDRKPRSFPYRVERSFGFIVGTLFLSLGSWWLFRSKFSIASPGLLTIGGLLVLLGAILPKSLVIPNRLWTALSEAISFVMTRVILTIVFFGIVTPVGILRRLFRGNSLGRPAPGSDSYWQSYAARQRDHPRHYEKMY